MDGILVVAHGSKSGRATEDFMQIITMLAERLPGKLIESAFLDSSELTIPKGITALIRREAKVIKVIPYFLFEGHHLLHTLPQVLDSCREEHPGVTITQGLPLGMDERLVDILCDRISEA